MNEKLSAAFSVLEAVHTGLKTVAEAASSDYRRAMHENCVELRAAIDTLQDYYAVDQGAQAHILALRAQLDAINNLRAQYADQARFADAEAAAYFREFIQRLDNATFDKENPHGS